MKNGRKKLNILTAVLMTIMILSGCSAQTGSSSATSSGRQKYRADYFDVDGVEVFNTIITLMSYEDNQETFNKYLDISKKRFLYYHKLFDIYHNYDGVNNVKTVNDNAGKEPVKVDKPLIDLVLRAKELYPETGKKANIAMGAVLSIWHRYREMYDAKGEGDSIPGMEELKAANEHVSLDDVIVDEKASTIFLKDPKMSLDVGAFAKGYAAEMVANELKEAGMTSGLMSAGGNIKIIGAPAEKNKTKWGIGIQDPFGGDGFVETLFMKTGSVVSSGDYERYYTYQGKRMHHLIDPETLMPAEFFSQVSIITEDSALADFLSTTIYLMPYEEGYKLAEKMGVEVMWVYKDKTVKTTPGLEKLMKSKGATSE